MSQKQFLRCWPRKFVLTTKRTSSFVNWLLVCYLLSVCKKHGEMHWAMMPSSCGTPRTLLSVNSSHIYRMRIKKIINWNKRWWYFRAWKGKSESVQYIFQKIMFGWQFIDEYKFMHKFQFANNSSLISYSLGQTTSTFWLELDKKPKILWFKPISKCITPLSQSDCFYLLQPHKKLVLFTNPRATVVYNFCVAWLFYL